MSCSIIRMRLIRSVIQFRWVPPFMSYIILLMSNNSPHMPKQIPTTRQRGLELWKLCKKSSLSVLKLSFWLISGLISFLSIAWSYRKIFQHPQWRREGGVGVIYSYNLKLYIHITWIWCEIHVGCMRDFSIRYKGTFSGSYPWSWSTRNTACVLFTVMRHVSTAINIEKWKTLLDFLFFFLFFL